MRKHYDFSKGKRGPVIPSPGKTRITIMLDDDVLEFYRNKAASQGTGYQTMINATLRDGLLKTKGRAAADKPVTLSQLRKTLREVLQAS